MEKIRQTDTGGCALPSQEFNGNIYYLYPGEKYFSRGRKRLHRIVWEFYNGPIPKGCEVHHKDRNPRNNDISNLECLTRSKHKEEHHDEQSRRGKSPEAIANIHRAGEFAKKWHSSEEGHNWHSEHARKQFEALEIRETTCECCGSVFKYKSFNTPRFCSNNCKSKWRRDAGLDNEERFCIYCGKKFITNHYSDTFTCSRSCAAKYRWQARRH